jgi:hypothetical protein
VRHARDYSVTPRSVAAGTAPLSAGALLARKQAGRDSMGARANPP